MIPTRSADRLAKLMTNADEGMIEVLYDQCEDDFKSICARDDVPERAQTLVEQMVMFRYSQLNSEGLASQSFSGQSEAFLTDYPERMKRAMHAYRRLICR